MPQAVKGNEGRYSGLLLHDHPTHPRINEGAGGRLISLYCGAAGTGGAGQSGLKPAPNPGETVAAWNNKIPVTNASIAGAFASSRALLAQFC